jgi:hypothetical protein
VAETSTLYWAHRRKNRPFNDPSAGWGSNSQWRTRFRRDYLVGPSQTFNVRDEGLPCRDLSRPASDEPDRDADGLTRPQRIELLVHRCFITVDKPHADLFPYHDTYTMPSVPAS